MSNESFVKQILDENLRLRHVIRRMYKETDKNAKEYIQQADALYYKENTTDRDKIESFDLKGRGLGISEANILLLRILMDEGFNDDINLIQ